MIVGDLDAVGNLHLLLSVRCAVSGPHAFGFEKRLKSPFGTGNRNSRLTQQTANRRTSVLSFFGFATSIGKGLIATCIVRLPQSSARFDEAPCIRVEATSHKQAGAPVRLFCCHSIA